MTRHRRVWRPGAGQHLISQFIDRRFQLQSTADREAYLEFVERSHTRWDWSWLSYALMSSHVHDGLVAGCQPLDRFYRSVHIRYAMYLRRTFKTLGPVFAGRPNNYEVKAQRLSRMVAYHHRNPVEAGIAKRASESRWTSHRAYLRLDKAPAFLDVEWAMSVLGFDDTPGGRTCFDEFVNDFDFDTYEPAQREPCSVDMSAHLVGNLKNRVLSEKSWQRLVGIVACQHSVSARALCSSRRRSEVEARRLVSYVAVRELGCSLADTSGRLGQRPTAIANLLSRMDDRALAAAKDDSSCILAMLKLEED